MTAWITTSTCRRSDPSRPPGDATLGDFSLTTGDGAGVTDERAVSLTAQDATELLLLDLREPPAPVARARG